MTIRELIDKLQEIAKQRGDTTPVAISLISDDGVGWLFQDDIVVVEDMTHVVIEERSQL